MSEIVKTYPEWICSSCGAKHGRRRCGSVPWHVGTCEICGIKASVTRPKHYRYLKPGWENGGTT